jgi:hypothetical protein
MYDHSGAGEKLRQFCSLHLAWWHNYKHASLCLWKFFAKDFFAGMHHCLFPGHPFYVSPPLSSVITQLSYVRLGYPAFREDLRKALSNENLQRHNKTVLSNLQCLCEFLIPVV